METSIANTKQETASTKATRSISAWSRELSLFILIVALGILAISIESQIPAVLAFYEEVLQQLDELEGLFDNPTLLMGG